MLPHPESTLPATVLTAAVKSGNELGWRRADLGSALEAAKAQGLAMLGGQLQVVLPGGTCELYWHSYDPEARRPGEDWEAYVARSHVEARQRLAELPDELTIVREAEQSFDFLRRRATEGVDLLAHLVYVCYFVSKDEEISLSDRAQQIRIGSVPSDSVGPAVPQRSVLQMIRGVLGVSDVLEAIIIAGLGTTLFLGLAVALPIWLARSLFQASQPLLAMLVLTISGLTLGAAIRDVLRRRWSSMSTVVTALWIACVLYVLVQLA